MNDILYGVVEWKLGLLPTGNIQFEIGYAATPEDAVASEHIKIPVYDLDPSGLMIDEYLRKGNPDNLGLREIVLIYVYNRIPAGGFIGGRYRGRVGLRL